MNDPIGPLSLLCTDVFEGKHQHDAADYPVNWAGLGEVSGHCCGVFWLVDICRYLRNNLLEELLVADPAHDN